MNDLLDHVAALKHVNNIKLALDSAWCGADTILLSELGFSLHVNTVMLHMDIPPCLVISNTSRPVVQCEHVHSITAETTTEGCGQVNQLWENSGVCSWRPAEKIYHEKTQNHNFQSRRKDKKTPNIMERESLQLVITARFQSDIIVCKFNWVQRKIMFPSYQTSLSGSEGWQEGFYRELQNGKKK